MSEETYGETADMLKNTSNAAHKGPNMAETKHI
jgi:hypothetical protein